jgi:hypothetical protein
MYYFFKWLNWLISFFGARLSILATIHDRTYCDGMTILLEELITYLSLLITISLRKSQWPLSQASSIIKWPTSALVPYVVQSSWWPPRFRISSSASTAGLESSEWLAAVIVYRYVRPLSLGSGSGTGTYSKTMTFVAISSWCCVFRLGPEFYWALWKSPKQRLFRLFKSG